MQEFPKNKKRRWWKTKTGVASIGVGAAVTGVGAIDLRKSNIPRKIKPLGETLEDAKKYIKPGDILVGGDKTAPQAFANEWRDAKKLFRRKIHGKTGIKRVSSAISATIQNAAKADYASMVSKFGDPEASHAALVVTPRRTTYIGGLTQHIGLDMPINKADLKGWKSEGYSTHYYLVRPKSASSSPLVQAYNKHGPKKASRLARKLSRDAYAYNILGAMKSGVKDFILPKLRSKEVKKSVESLASRGCPIKGSCGTLPAQMATTTVGGKKVTDVLPRDYLYSNKYKVVGKIGAGKITKLQKSLFQIPKWGFRAGAGALAAGATYGATRAVQKLMKKNENDMDKTSSLNDNKPNDIFASKAKAYLAGGSLGTAVGIPVTVKQFERYKKFIHAPMGAEVIPVEAKKLQSSMGLNKIKLKRNSLLSIIGGGGAYDVGKQTAHFWMKGKTPTAFEMGMLGHEFGHAKNLNKAIFAPYATTRLLNNPSLVIGSLGAAFAKDDKTAKKFAIGGSIIPGIILGEELIASGRGIKGMTKYHGGGIKGLSKALLSGKAGGLRMLGYNTGAYAAVAAAPALTYMARKYFTKKQPEKTASLHTNNMDNLQKISGTTISEQNFQRLKSLAAFV